MPSLNDRIAKVKGWTWEERHPYFLGSGTYATWVNPEGYAAERPDFTGTLEGVAGMLRELNDNVAEVGCQWNWYWHPWLKQYRIRCTNVATGQLMLQGFASPDDRPGDCVGEAWLSMKEAADASEA